MKLAMPESSLRAFFVASGLALWIGCALVPVEPSASDARIAPRFTVDHYPFVVGDVVFSHDVHSSVPCERCHFETAGRAASRAELELPAMAVCFECHDGSSLSRECSICHKENRREVKPRFHDAQWPRHHKDMAGAEAYKCALCHAERDCRDCHMFQRPLSHTPRFNRSEHGRLATHDRESCATCHARDF
jgi:hypothetical protein